MDRPVTDERSSRGIVASRKQLLRDRRSGLEPRTSWQARLRLAVVLLVFPGAAAAQDVARFTLVADAPGRVWVLDGATGSLARCRHADATAPKIVEVFGAAPAPLSSEGAGSAPECWKWGEMAGRAEPGTEGWVVGEAAPDLVASTAAIPRPKVLSVFGGEVYATSP